MSVDGEEITVAVKTTFEVSSLTVADGKVTLVATVTVGKGQALPETVTLGGNVKVKVAKNLTDGWDSEPRTFGKPNLTRVDNQTYQMRMEIDLSEYTFYQVIVE